MGKRIEPAAKVTETEWDEDKEFRSVKIHATAAMRGGLEKGDILVRAADIVAAINSVHSYADGYYYCTEDGCENIYTPHKRTPEEECETCGGTMRPHSVVEGYTHQPLQSGISSGLPDGCSVELPSTFSVVYQ